MPHQDPLAQQLAAADRLHHITQRAGLALWRVQELEHAAAQYFVVVVQATRGMGEADGQALVDKAAAKTFGASLRAMKDAGVLPDALRARFEALLSERNWLAHRSVADSRPALRSDEAALALAARLDAITKAADQLLPELLALLQAFTRRHGVDGALVEQLAQQQLREWWGDEV